MKTVYPPTNTVCRGYKDWHFIVPRKLFVAIEAGHVVIQPVFKCGEFEDGHDNMSF